MYVYTDNLICCRNYPWKTCITAEDKKIKVIDNINLWTDAFLIFTMVLIENHPSKATELMRYMYIIRNIATFSFNV
jgi:hypothetical protein